MLQQDDQHVYESFSLPYYDRPSSSLGVSDAPSVVPASPEQGISQPPKPPVEHNVVSPVPPHRSGGRVGAILLLTFVLLLVFGVGLFAGWVFVGTSSRSTSTGTNAKVVTTTSASSSSTTTIEALQEAAIAKVEPAVVELKVTTAQGQQIGSGVIIDSKGDIVTNNHVINGEQSIVAVMSNGSTEQAQLIGTSPSNDLAVVRIAPFAHMTVVPIGDSSKLVVGQEILAIGNPLGITETATKGIVSALNRSVTESTGATLTQAIQTDAAVNPGNSGGALVNLQGQLIGIPTLTAVNSESNTAANGVSFAISSNTIQTVIQQIVKQ